MKTTTIQRLACMLTLSLLFALKIMAQQPASFNHTPQQMMKIIAAGEYSYRILPASNNSFGYDLFQGKRLIFHQPTLAFITNNGTIVYPVKEKSEKIIFAAIEKIKNGKLPVLTNEELKRIAQ
jgi:hypothetical protein